MSITVMKQALEALEKCIYPQQKQFKAITALRQAIEQAEKQEPVAWMVRDSIDGSWYPCAFENPAGAIKGESKPLYAVPQQAEKQEPVTWDGGCVLGHCGCPDGCDRSGCCRANLAPRKEWVGLTELEIKHYNSRLSGSGVAQKIEEKLRERNT